MNSRRDAKRKIVHPQKVLREDVPRAPARVELPRR
jgi:hypothetical protein